MAGTVVTSERIHGSAKKVIFAWTSAASGAADATTVAAFDGRIVGLITIPGTPAPTTLYDVAVLDGDGHDVLLGAGADRSAAVTEYKTEANLAAVAASKLTLAVTNAGDAKQGTVILFIR